MTGTEFMVGLVFLLLGYWIVSYFLEGKAGPRAQPAAGGAWHVVLDVDPDASVEQIRAAYHALRTQYHPDRVASLGPELREVAERKSKELTAAYREAMRLRGVELHIPD